MDGGEGGEQGIRVGEFKDVRGYDRSDPSPFAVIC
jgi:hypothetical protein